MRKSASKNTKTLTDAQLVTLKENAVGILAGGRKTLLDRFPFIGSVAMSLDLIPTRDLRNPTMCTDGDAIYCDIDFLSTLSSDNMIFVLAHEIYHNIMLHFIRLDNRDPKLFNYATDLEVNQLLEADGFSVPKNCLMPDMFKVPKGKAAEEYYELLLQQAKNNHSFSGGSGKSSGNSDGQLEGQFDKHIFKDDNIEHDEKYDNAENSDIQDSYGKIGYDKDFRPNPTETAIERIRESAITAAQNIERQGGTLPNHIKQMVTKLLEPKLNWKELLAKFVTRSNGIYRTWNRPNRRFASRGLYLPSTYGNKMRAVIGIDTSGSVTNYVKRFMSEINGLVKSFAEYELTIIQCDTKVQKVNKYSHENPLDLERTEFELEGFGGTILKPIFEYVNENQSEADCIVMLTDGYLADDFKPTDEPEIPVLWCVTKDGSKDKLVFGEIADLID